MESPYGRMAAVNLIAKVLDDIHRRRIEEPFLCGYSTETLICRALKQAGYLTEEAMVPAKDSLLNELRDADLI